MNVLAIGNSFSNFDEPIAAETVRMIKATVESLQI